MLEIELRLQVPPSARAAVRRAVTTTLAQVRRVQSVYFDTADGRLAAASAALRLRRDGRRWLQTFKAGGADALHRVEHEVPLLGTRAGQAPHPDPTLHDGSAAGALLRAALAGQVELQPVFETDFRRASRVVRVGGTRIELCLDLGEIRAAGRTAPLCELELEWKSGPLDGLFVAARRWIERHGLQLDLRSKSERALALAAGGPTPPVAATAPPVLPFEVSGEEALRALIGTTLAQLLPNAAVVAAGGGSPEHLHQARVAMRRLRTMLRHFELQPPLVGASTLAALEQVFDRSGGARDRDALSAAVLPALREAGAPLADWPQPAEAEVDEAALFAGIDANLAWLDLLACSHAPCAADATALRERLPALLKRLHRQLARDAARFADTDDASRHRTRRRVKRLRYTVEAVSSLLPGRDTRRYLRRLAAAQTELGHFNDLCVAQQLFRAEAERDARAWFAVGWLEAQRAQQLHRADRQLRRFAQLPALRMKSKPAR